MLLPTASNISSIFAGSGCVGLRAEGFRDAQELGRLLSRGLEGGLIRFQEKMRCLCISEQNKVERICRIRVKDQEDCKKA